MDIWEHVPEDVDLNRLSRAQMHLIKLKMIRAEFQFRSMCASFECKWREWYEIWRILSEYYNNALGPILWEVVARWIDVIYT